MPSPVYALFRQAVSGRKQVICIYQNYRRELCPHCVGHKGGREKALSLRFAGGSKTGLPPVGQWRCMFLDEVSDVQLREGDWHTGTGHSRTQTCIDNVDVEIAY